MAARRKKKSARQKGKITEGHAKKYLERHHPHAIYLRATAKVVWTPRGPISTEEDFWGLFDYVVLDPHPSQPSFILRLWQITTWGADSKNPGRSAVERRMKILEWLADKPYLAENSDVDMKVMAWEHVHGWHIWTWSMANQEFEKTQRPEKQVEAFR